MNAFINVIPMREGRLGHRKTEGAALVFLPTFPYSSVMFWVPSRGRGLYLAQCSKLTSLVIVRASLPLSLHLGALLLLKTCV